MVTMENFNLYIMLCAFYVMLFTTIKNKMNWTSLVVQWLRLHASNAGDVEVRSLFGELRSHVPHGEAKKEKDVKK